MNTFAISFREANAIPITEYLATMGHEPKIIRGNDHWYLSPFRDERHPSFKVNSRLNLWYDHGSGVGGTLIDLGLKLENTNYQGIIEKLAKGNYSSLPISVNQRSPDPIQSKLEILSARSIINPQLISYLDSRGISPKTAEQYCKEIEFRMNNRIYVAIGFPNRSGGYELRNEWFKGSSSPKDITTFHNGSDKICITEGFIDFLSLNEINHPGIKRLSSRSDFIILNSLSFLKRCEPIIKSHERAVLFLDNDAPGQKAKADLTSLKIEFEDASVFYAFHKDLNEFLMDTIKNQQGEYLPRRRSRRMRM